MGIGTRLAGWSVALAALGCAPAAKDLKQTLAADTSGEIWLASAGGLDWSPDGSGLRAGAPVALAGRLSFPEGAGPFPAVVLAHGCGGVGNAEGAWAKVLREWGYATLVLDSFRGRNLSEVCADARRLLWTQRIPDVYAGLRALATHPAVDPTRIALMGFSHGGIATLQAATQWARETYVAKGAPGFRAFLAFYPACNFDFPEQRRLSAPLRIHAGELDDWTPAAPCADLVQALARAGQDAGIVVYPGARHSFDNVGVPVMARPGVRALAGCTFSYPAILGPYSRAADRPECFRWGVTLGFDAEATRQARDNVRAQLGELLR